MTAPATPVTCVQSEVRKDRHSNAAPIQSERSRAHRCSSAWRQIISNDSASSASSVKTEAMAPATVSVPRVPFPDSVCVLLVEDDQVLCAVSADTLNDLGYRAIRTSNGTQALNALERDHDIKILMTDIGLPGMDGQQL